MIINKVIFWGCWIYIGLIAFMVFVNGFLWDFFPNWHQIMPCGAVALFKPVRNFMIAPLACDRSVSYMSRGFEVVISSLCMFFFHWPAEKTEEEEEKKKKKKKNDLNGHCAIAISRDPLNRFGWNFQRMLLPSCAVYPESLNPLRIFFVQNRQIHIISDHIRVSARNVQTLIADLGRESPKAEIVGFNYEYR